MFQCLKVTKFLTVDKQLFVSKIELFFDFVYFFKFSLLCHHALKKLN